MASVVAVTMPWLLNRVLLVLLFVIPAKAAPVGAEVKEFPGFDGELPSKHYAGYISVGDEGRKRHLYYYFAAAERNPSEDPITFWINGGPGCSGIAALTQLVGPFEVEPDSFHYKRQPKLRLAPYSWTKISSVLSVDSPAGVGYSYAENTDDYNTDDAETVIDLYEFIMKWYSEYPEFLPNPLYLSGCSYSGVIVPVVAQEIAKGIESGREPKINLKGYSVGNGAIDVDFAKNARVPFAYKMGLISEEHYQDLVSSCQGKYYDNSNPDCLKNLELFQYNIQGINGYHILCLHCHFQMGIRMDDYESESLRMYESIHGSTPFPVYCHGYELASQRLFSPETSRQILHAASEEITGPWIRCSKKINYERVILSTTSYHLNLTKKGYRAFLCCGDHDMVIPYNSNLDWIKTFNYSVISKWHPWFVDDQIAGYAVQYEHNLLFATFKGAGHTLNSCLGRHWWLIRDGSKGLTLCNIGRRI